MSYFLLGLDTHAKKISRLQELIHMLPEKHYFILKRLMYHLNMYVFIYARIAYIFQ